MINYGKFSYFENVPDSNCSKCGGTGSIKMSVIHRLIMKYRYKMNWNVPWHNCKLSRVCDCCELHRDYGVGHNYPAMMEKL